MLNSIMVGIPMQILTYDNKSIERMEHLIEDPEGKILSLRHRKKQCNVYDFLMKMVDKKLTKQQKYVLNEIFGRDMNAICDIARRDKKAKTTYYTHYYRAVERLREWLKESGNYDKIVEYIQAKDQWD